MSFYATETDMVRLLASRFRRAGALAQDMAEETAEALAISGLQSSAVTDSLHLAERLERASIDLANYSQDVDDSERQNRFEKIENRIGIT